MDKNTTSEEILKLSKWKQLGLGLHKPIVSYLRKELGFNKVTKVQREVIPLFTKHKDVCVKACTGSGKTLAYVLSALQILMNDDINAENPPNKDDLLCLILVPARELANQVFNVLKGFKGLFPYLTFNLCVGGQKIQDDIDQFQEQGSNILVGTIGRIWDYVDRNVLNLKPLKVLIIDEADMFIEDLSQNTLSKQVKLSLIMDRLPKERRTGLFSATMTNEIKNLVKAGLRNPFYIEIYSYKNEAIRNNYEPFAIENLRDEYCRIEEFFERELRQKIKNDVNTEIPSTLTNYYMVLDSQDEKLATLLRFLIEQLTPEVVENKGEEEDKNEELKEAPKTKGVKIILFLSTCASVDFYNTLLPLLFKKYDIAIPHILKLHRKVKQAQRTKIYSKFSNLKTGILLTTDVSARGLDIPNVDWIVQLDPPQDSNQYVHRIGRTARAGKQGDSVIFLQKHEESYVKFLEKRKVNIKPLEWNQSEEVANTANLRNFVYTEMKQDKDLVDKAQNAFVSFVRYYKEHELKYIFAFNQLPIDHVANSFFLFRMPRIKEILGKKWDNFVTQSINLDKIPYKNQNKQNQKELMKDKIEEKLAKKREAKLQRKEVAEQQKEMKNKIYRTQKKRHRKEIELDEWDDLATEQRLLKKLRNGKISQAEFDAHAYKGLDQI